jgi:matrixin
MSEIPYTQFKKLNLTYKLENLPLRTPLTELHITNAIVEAFAKWQNVSPFTFSPSTSAGPDIKLSFGGVSLTDGRHAHALTDWDKHTTVFNNSCTWVELAEPDIHRPNLLSVAVHEIGHLLGLRDTTDPISVMTAGDYNKLRTISQSPIPQLDIDTLKKVYPNEFSEYYASQGKTTWWDRGNKGFQFVQVSTGLDNTVWAIDYNRNAREFGPLDDYGSAWSIRGHGMMRIAAFSEHLVLGLGIGLADAPQKSFPADKYSVDDFYDLKRYDQRNRSWIRVSTGRLGSGTKFGFVTVGPGGSVWAIANRAKSSVQEIVRYDGDIISGTGDWTVVPFASDVGRDTTFLDLAVGRRNGKPWIWVTLPTHKSAINSDDSWSRPLDFAASNDEGQTWSKVQPITNVQLGDTSEKKRYLLVGKCVSVGDDGTAVRVFKDSAYRFDGSTWIQLPGQFSDVSVISKNNMWAVDYYLKILSTIVKPL